MDGERGDVGAAFAEGRQVDREDAEPVVKVLPEGAAGDRLAEIALRGGQHTDVGFERFRTTHPLELPVLQEPEELGLEVLRQLADLGQQERAAIGEFELSLAALGRIGKGTLFVTEEQAFEQARSCRRAVHGEIRRVCPVARAENLVGDEILSRARFALDEHRGLGRGDLAQPCAERPERRAFAREIARIAALRGEAFADFQHLLVVFGLLYEDLDLTERKRLDEVVEGSVTQTVDGGFDRAEAAHHDGQRTGGLLGDESEEFGAVAIGQADVEKDQVKGITLEQLLR